MFIVSHANAYYWYNTKQFFNNMPSSCTTPYAVATTTIDHGTRTQYKGKSTNSVGNCEKETDQIIKSKCPDKNPDAITYVTLCDCDTGYYSYVSNSAFTGGCTADCTCRPCPTDDPNRALCRSKISAAVPTITCNEGFHLMNFSEQSRTGDYCVANGGGDIREDYTHNLIGCMADYYHIPGSVNCSACPDGGKRDGNQVLNNLAALAITNCYIPTTKIISDSTGKYRYNDKCYYTE